MTKALKIFGWFFLSLVVLTGIYIVKNFNPELNSFFPPCIFHEITGLYCPGCGMTRATYSILNLEIKKAFGYNQLFFILIPVLIYMGIKQVFNLKKYGELKPIRFPYWFTISLLFLVFLFWILRNIPIYPFKYLAP